VKGTTYKRCKCAPRYNDAGKRLTCPKKHGAWAFALAVPLTDDGRKSFGRPQLTRSGFAREDAAEAELRRAIQLLEIPDPDDDAGRMQVVALIRNSYQGSNCLPEYDDVRRKFAAGVTLVRNQTTGDWLDEWLASKRGRASGTYRSYAGHIRLHLKPNLGHVPLARLRRAHVQAAYDAILAANVDRTRTVGPATLARVHATLRKSLNDAVAQGVITDNPARHVELEAARRPKPVVWTRARVLHWLKTGERPKVAVWTPVQTGHFLDYASGDRLYAYYHLLVFRGPRRGEGVGLRWVNLDLEAAVLDVAEQIVQVGWGTEVTTPKAGSDGLVALDSGTVAILRAHADRQTAEARAWGEAWADTGYVFTTEAGQPIHPDYVSRHFVRLVKRANQLKVGDIGGAVRDVQARLGLAVTGVYGKDTLSAVWQFQRDAGLVANGIVDPHAWYRLFPDEPLRSYPHPGYLPPIRLHDLRHLAATLALAAGAEMKVVSAMLRHKTLAITADTYTSVLPEVARAAAEAAVRIVPRRTLPDSASAAASTSLARDRKTKLADLPNGRTASSERVRRQGLEPRTRGLRVRCSAN